MRIDNAGNVGIGTTDPKRKLHIQADNSATFTAMAIENADTTNGNGSVVSFRTNTTGTNASSFVEYAGFVGKVIDHNHDTRSSDMSLFAQENGVYSYLTLKGNGNVGIGTATPTAKLSVSGSVSIKDGTQGLGKFLTSDANGLASWLSLTGGSITGLNAGQVTFGSASGGLAQSSNLYWDNTNGRLGIGTSIFGSNGILQVNGDIGLSGNRTIRSASDSDTDSLRLLATKVVIGNTNSNAYSYAGNGLFAIRSNADGANLLDI
jgi:hypothetical protein